MSVALVLVAAGQGTRLGESIPKALVLLHGEPLVQHALRRALESTTIEHVVIVAPASHLREAGAVVSACARPDRVTIVAGGGERSDSVAAGLAGLPEQADVVLVHDAARCLAPPELFDAVAAAVLAGHDAVVPGLPVVDTVKQVDGQGQVVATPDRSALRAVQTPQGFRRALLEQAHARGGSVTDDAALVEAMGLPVQVVEGDPRAHKVTTPQDLVLAAYLLGD